MPNRWLIAFACAWVNLFIFSVFRSSGLIYVKVIELFKCSHQQAAYSVSLVGSVASTTGIASGFLTHYFAPRTLILIGILICSISTGLTFFANSIWFVIVSVGIFQGIGIGFVTCLLPAVLSAYFDEQKSIALGISYAGATLGAFIFPLLIQWMFDQYGFHGSMLILGALILNATVGAILLKQPSAKRSEIPLESVENNSPGVTDSQHHLQPESTNKDEGNFLKRFKNHLVNDYRILSNFHFILCSFTYINFIVNFIAFIIILPDVAKDRNIDGVDAKWLLSIFAITDFIGRLVPGWFSYWRFISDKTSYILSSFVLGLCMFLIISINLWLHFVLVSLLCGFVCGCQMVLSPAILADYLGIENTAIAFGMENFICGIISMFLRPMIIGVKDIHGNYDWLGYILFTSVIVNTALWIFEILFQKVRTTDHQLET